MSGPFYREVSAMIPACETVCQDPEGEFKSADDADSRIVDLAGEEDRDPS